MRHHPWERARRRTDWPTWHVSEALAARYAAGSAPEPDAWSLEKHIEACGACAVRVSTAVQGSAAGPVLAEVRGAVLATVVPDPSTGQGPPHRVGFTARVLWAAGPALRGSWLVALVLVAAAAVGLAYGAGFAGARPVLLALAPTVPPAGVALSYGRYADPMYEIGASTPGGGLRLLLTRTAAVLLASLPVLTLTGALLPASAEAPGPAAWLLPGLALTLAALALGSYVGCRTAAGVVAAVWAAAVTVPVLGMPRPDTSGYSPLSTAELSMYLTRFLSGATAQSAWAMAAAVCAGLLILRRRAFDRPAFDGRGRSWARG
ncbi:zf-HC2 domain-containing protein [Streptomyces sp. NPDC059892]|uniref:zf-HC2 domain-containing protein n=1 Tax=Streptomyces sp. NPDC059892 TaxID=3346989 RepID=UPI00365E09F5